MDSETGYHYNWHRYYDPETGRYLTPDPIGLAGGMNAYAYTNHDPMGSVDPWGLDSISASGITTFKTAFADLPEFTINTIPGWEDYKTNSTLGHVYNQQVSVGSLTLRELQQAQAYIINHPVPNGVGLPATTNGTYNNATPDHGPFEGAAANAVAPDHVYSFIRTGFSGRQYVVNVTAKDHSLAYGIVIRGVHCQSGKNIFDNYGEGAGIAQSWVNPFRDVLINNVWYWVTEELLENVTGRSYEVNGINWTDK